MAHSASGAKDGRAHRAAFALRRLHSLTGVFPLGLFIVVQLAAHAKALEGEAAYVGLWQWAADHAAWQYLVLFPLLFHGGYGVFLAVTSRYTVSRYGGSANWLHALQRVTGVATLLLVGYWLSVLWWPLAHGALAPAAAPSRLVGLLSTTSFGIPWIALGTLVGLGALSFHLGQGVWSFGISWGLWASRRGRRRASIAAVLLALGCFAFAARPVVYLATGWRLGAPPREAPLAPSDGGDCGLAEEGDAP